MKKEDLLAQGLTEEQVAFVMQENGKDIERVKTKLTVAETARDEYKEQLEAALQIDEDGMTTAKRLYKFLELDPSNYAKWVKNNIT